MPLDALYDFSGLGIDSAEWIHGTVLDMRVKNVATGHSLLVGNPLAIGRYRHLLPCRSMVHNRLIECRGNVQVLWSNHSLPLMATHISRVFSALPTNLIEVIMHIQILRLLQHLLSIGSLLWDLSLLYLWLLNFLPVAREILLHFLFKLLSW